MKKVGDVVVIVECSSPNEEKARKNNYFTNLIYGRYVLGTLQAVSKDSLRAIGDDGKIYQTTFDGSQNAYKFLDLEEAYKCFKAEISAAEKKLGETKEVVRKFDEGVEKHRSRKHCN